MRAVTLLALLALGTVGCKGCGSDRPYVPFAIEEAAAPVAVEDAGSVVSDDAGTPFVEQPALVAPAGASTWTLEGLPLVAPAGEIFALGLAFDFDADGARDAVAVARPVEGGAPGELVFFKGRPGAGGVDAPTRAASPPPIASDPACAPSARLARVGLHSVFVELGVACPGRPQPRPGRWIAVVAFAHDPAVQLSALLSDPPGAPKLSVDVDGSDFDGDGRDDVALRITLEGGDAPFEPGPRISAVLRWLDRPAGMSRQADQPESSLKAIASQAAARAKGKDAASVPRLVQQVRALYAAICGEGGSPRLTRLLGGERPISCGNSHALEDAGLAETRAFATLGNTLRATSALDRAQRPPATRTASRTAEAQGWIVQSAPIVMASNLRVVSALPLIDRGHGPSWGALAFEPGGKLLVRTPSAVVRVDADQGDETEAPDVAPWKALVASPDGGTRWVEAYDACDNFALHATFAPMGDGSPRDVDLPVEARLGARCTGSKEPVPVLPLAWGASGLEAIVAGEPVLVATDLSRAVPLAAQLGQPVALGSPRSPDGRTMVVPTSQGILIRGAKNRLYRAKELEGAYLELRDCAVSDDARHVACVRGGRAFAGSWEAP